MENVSLGDFVAVFYEEFLALYGDEEMAAVAAAGAINELMAVGAEEEIPSEEPVV
ncbi:MAG: hypothetical protein UX57_C0014G0021 [Candidatus Uhrbacteria bacterium GW2011_GWE2_46_68]|uniref:Uncharacterized protein n=1 Tax=Candidatus Uhrbacteria bacterium GW2011_GWE2_46_68 TaxID=1618994 RepID=A0A0G1Q688_9BACT|nr:MAG: hypothetical protein UX57_C0014G0021 [Candidatus Uhrbacteria bacterium GW2011_GWE2_46_68]